MSSLALRTGRGLLIAAMLLAVACGDDEGDNNAGAGGTAGDAGGDGDGDGDGDVTVAECMTMTTTNTGGMVSTECSMCLCTTDIDVAVDCNAGCWAFIGCLRTNCAEELASGNLGMITTCATAPNDEGGCMDEVSVPGASAAATAIGDVIEADCMVCSTVDVPDDAGDDAGN